MASSVRSACKRALPAVVALAGASLSATSCDGEEKWRKLSAEGHKLDHHLIHASLKGPNKFERYEAEINDADQVLVVKARLGKEVCGHPRIVHGGAIAALLDDAMGILFLNSGLGTGYTANLNVNYRKPLPAGTDVAVSARIVSVEPSKSNPNTKKVTIAATVHAENDKSVVYTESTALFIVKHVPGGALWHATIRAVQGLTG